jgi:hypothetical protein
MKLWTFGDSFSCSFSSDYIFVRRYRQFKGYTPKIYSEIISENLGVELINCAKSADSNYDIMHRFVQEVENISEDDIVFVQFTSLYRFRLIDKKGDFSPIAGHWNEQYPDFEESANTIKEIGVNRLSKKYMEEVDDWIKIIKLLLKKNKVVFWTPFIETSENKNMIQFNQFMDITKESNYKIKDSHYGEIGHSQLADFIMKKIITNEKRIL